MSLSTVYGERFMNLRKIVLWGIALGMSMYSSCQNPVEPVEEKVQGVATVIRGTVLRNDNLSPIRNASVYDVDGRARDTSKSDGSYRLTYQLTSVFATRIVASAAGFKNDTAAVTLRPGADTTIVLKVKADSASPGIGLSSGKPANIVLIGASTENVSIRGTGPNETSVLTFEVRDSLGVPVGGINTVKVRFTILGGPGGGEYVFPVEAQTDPLTGRVSTRVTSGEKAGVIQVYASTVVGTLTIKSSPVRLTISGGLPVLERFSISRQRANVAGGVFDNLRTGITVVVGDKYGNPVQPGTAVYFTTTGGIIQSSALTDNDGIASVNLITGNPRPPNSIAVVTATTVGDSGVLISRSIPVTFSGSTRVIVPTSTVIVPDSGFTTFSYRVQDPNGLPIVGGSQITLTVDGPGATDLVLSGDVNRTMPDTDDPNATLFTATVRDTKLKGGGPVTFKIEVKSQNGDVTRTFPGLVSLDTTATPPPSLSPTSGYASSLTLISTTSTQVSVRGTGDGETARLTFIARDSLGRAVDGLHRAYVSFRISPAGGLGGGEFLSPPADSTDASGQVATVFNAGTRAGVVQVIAQATVLGRTISSSPVRLTIAGGLPVEERFSISRERANIAGGLFDGLRARFNVVVGDQHGNPVRPTSIYFTTTGGIIQPSAVTNADGQASVEVITGNPRPQNGIAVITARTISESGTTISKNIPIVFSGRTRIIAPTTAFEVPDSGEYSFAYKVQDANGNPLVAGTAIRVTVSGPGSAGLELGGDDNITLPDTDDPFWTSFSVTLRDRQTGGPSGPVTVKIDVTSQNGNASHTFSGVVKPAASVITVPPSAREPSQIAIIGNPTASDIFVAGVGAVENSVITYEVRDSLGVPIDTSRRVTATFGVSFFPNSFVQGGTPPTVIPTSAVTDNRGRFTANVTSGTQAGIVQLVARIALPNGRTIVSEPVKISVHAGFPNQNHFTIMTSNWAFAGLDFVNQIGFSVLVGDTFSNPVQAGTAIYWHTQAGVMQTGTNNPGASYTGANGVATSVLYTGNPRPTTLPHYDPTVGRGYHWVYAQTQGRGGRRIIDSLLVLVCGGPIQIIGLPTSFTIPRQGTSAPIPFQVRDGLGNPLPTSTRITVSVAYDNTVTGIKFVPGGDFSESSPTHTIPNAAYVRFPGPLVTDYVVRVQDASSGTGAPAGMSVTLTISINAPGIGIITRSIPGTVQ